MADSKRRTELSWLNLIFCGMVLWSHSSSYALTHLDKLGWPYAATYSLQRICFVSVYGFFFLSGLKLTLSRRKPPSPLTFWGKRFKVILLPYCLAVMVYYLWFSQILHYFPFSATDYLGYLVRGDLSSPFYFAVALAQFILLAPLLRKIAERYSPILLIPTALVVTLLSVMYCNDIIQIFAPGASFAYGDRIFPTYLVYYLAGCCAGRWYEEFLAMLEHNKGLIAGMTAALTALDIVLCWLSYTGRRSVHFTEITAMLFHLSAILLGFLVALRLPRHIPGWLTKVDRASYLIYLYHSLALSGIDTLLRRLGIVRVSMVFPIRAAFVFTATPLACILWQRLWGRLHQKFVGKGADK